MTPTSAQSTSILVVGAGPVGLVIGCELARRRVPFRLIDKLAQPTDESRAIAVHARSLEMMERIGVVEPLMASGIRANAMTFHGDREMLGRVDLTEVDSPFPFSISTAQTETERILTERLNELGGRIERGLELVSLEQDAGEVRSTLRDAGGRLRVVSSGWIVGTDGSHSTVRAQLGMKLEGSFKRERFLLGDVDVDADADVVRESMHTFFSEDGPLVVFPMQGRRMRLIAQVMGDANGAEPTLAELQEIADRRAGGIRLSTAHWLTTFEIHSAQVPQYRHGRAFLAGDAAHVHSPAGGQGMNTGMQDAFNLGWKLTHAHKGIASEQLLDSYHAERHPVAARVLEHSATLTNIGTLQNELARKLRKHALQFATGLAPLRHRVAANIEETDIDYRESPIVVNATDGDAVRAGDAAPDVSELRLHEVLARGKGHTALYIAPDGDAMPPAGEEPGRSVLVADSEPVDRPFDEFVLDPERRVARRYGVDGDDGSLFLVRPDGYVGLRADLGDPRAIADYLACLQG